MILYIRHEMDFFKKPASAPYIKEQFGGKIGYNFLLRKSFGNSLAGSQAGRQQQGGPIEAERMIY